MLLQNQRRLPVSIISVKIAAVGSLKRGLLEGLLVSTVTSEEQAQTLSFIFSSTLKQKNCKNYKRMYRKYVFITIIILKTIKEEKEGKR
jgi:hypothetical protein